MRRLALGLAAQDTVANLFGAVSYSWTSHFTSVTAPYLHRGWHGRGLRTAQHPRPEP